MIEFADIVISMDLEGSVEETLPSLHDKGTFTGVAIDSRQVVNGDLFVALPGEHVDGHDYVVDAFNRGARGALVRRDWLATHMGLFTQSVSVVADLDSLALADVSQRFAFAVDDPQTALQRLSAVHRRRMSAAVVGITGSVGKTSTKETTAAVLRQQLRTLHSGKSYNNEIGVPLTLLRLEPQHEVAVVEMGTYGPGEIAFLCELAKPRYAIVTNIGVSHLDRMKTQEIIAQAKAELVESLPLDGVAILNYDDPRVRAMAGRTQARSLFYGLDPHADLWADAIESHDLEGISFTVHYGTEEHRLDVPLLGRHAVYIALPAIAVGLEMGLSLDAIRSGLCNGGIQSRMVVVRGVNGATILDDSYNAAPASCKAALDVLASTPGRRTAVFGEMAELGPVEESGHREVGEAAVRAVDRLVVVGNKARWIGEGALAQPNPPEVIFTQTNQETAALLRPVIDSTDVVLVKGARVARTEEIVNALRAEENEI